MNDRPPQTAQLTEGPTSVGTFFKSKSPALAESLCGSSLDFIVVDRQHTSVDLETVESVARAADLGGLLVVARMATTNFDFVNCLLDAGAHALMIPQTETPDDIRDVVEETQYDERRSLSMGTRSGRFGTRDREEYFEWVRERLAIIPQIETATAVERADELASVESVSALMVGPTDLAHSLGVSKDDEEFRQAVHRVIDAAREAECGVGTFAASPEEYRAWQETMDFVIYSSDAGLISLALEHIEE